MIAFWSIYVCLGIILGFLWAAALSGDTKRVWLLRLAPLVGLFWPLVPFALVVSIIVMTVMTERRRRNRITNRPRHAHPSKTPPHPWRNLL